jgi:hypothetical protein
VKRVREADGRMGGTSRRSFLRGAGVCLALPFLESVVPRSLARAQSTAARRFIAIYFPNGAAASYWPVKGQGQGDAWQLSPVLEPFAALKSKMTVFTNLENYSSMADNPDVEPSHARLCGAFLTCADSDRIREAMQVEVANAVSVDQLIAASMKTPIASLQLGLSTLDSYLDGRHASLSRSISWKTATEPTYKEVNPQAVFDRLVAAGATEGGGTMSAEQVAEAKRRKALKLSALDFVLESAKSLTTRLGREDKPRLDQFMTSVRELEQRVAALDATMGPGGTLQCEVMDRPPEAYAVNVVDGYNRGTHSAVMNDLMVMALQCDVTRVVSHMLDDARSDFVYDHLINREFTADGSVEGNGTVNGYHGLQHAGDSNNGYATINWWLSTQVADLCQKLDAIDEGEGSVLDNSVVLYGGAMHGSDHNGNELPMTLIGGGSLGLRQNQHVVFPAAPNDRPLRDLYYTLLNRCFDMNVDKFGESILGAQNKLVDEILL